VAACRLGWLRLHFGCPKTKAGICVSTVSIVGHVPRRARCHQTGLNVVVAGGASAVCAEPDPLFPMLLTVLTVLTVFSVVARILMILFPARPSRLNAMSMSST
jgi:hypothetical protein